MSQIKFSIITCTWNSAKYLQQSIDSVLRQSYKNYEFVFVDGGSEDKTLEIIDSVSESKEIAHGIRGGIAKAMNVGTAMARGDVIVHLHSDDYFLHENVLQRASTVLSATGAGWLFGRILNRYGTKLVPETYISPEYSYQALIKSNIVPHAATFVRKRVYDDVGGFDPNLSFAMDYDMWLRIGRRYSAVQIRDALAVFRRHEGSTTERNRLKSFDEDYKVRQRYLSGGLWEKGIHYARYLVRRRRLEALLRSKGEMDIACE